MKKLSSYADVVALWPSLAQMERDVGITGKKGEMVRKWRDRDYIHPYWWPKIIKTTTAREHGISLELLTRLAANRYDLISS